MELKCEDVIRALSSYLDDELTPQVRAEIETHLFACAHCTAILDGTRNVMRLVSETRTFELPARFHEHLFRLIC